MRSEEEIKKKECFEALAGKRATILKANKVSDVQKGQETGESWNTFLLRYKSSLPLQLLVCPVQDTKSTLLAGQLTGPGSEAGVVWPW